VLFRRRSIPVKWATDSGGSGPASERLTQVKNLAELATIKKALIFRRCAARREPSVPGGRALALPRCRPSGRQPGPRADHAGSEKVGCERCRSNHHFPRTLGIVMWYIVIRYMARKPQFGPASDPEMLILTSLAAGSKHGYAVMQDIEQFSGVKLGPGTLYTAITRLVEKEMIRPEPVEDRQRPYRITKAGLAVLSEDLQMMRKIANFGLGRLRAI
jgi:DNA-binding PadR family transcriptional regulator